MKNPSEQLWDGVDVLLDDYAQVKTGHKVFVAYTPDSREPTAWIGTALKMRDIESKFIMMNALQDETFAQRLKGVLPPPTREGERFTLITVERDTMSHTGVFRDVLSHYEKDQYSVFRIINASEEFFTHAMRVRPTELSALNTALLERLMFAQELRIKTSGGTDLHIHLDSDKYKWISNRGVRQPGSFVILPAGEVATYPASVNGELVVDGAFNLNLFTKADARLGRCPIKIHIRDSKAVDFECSDIQVSRLLDAVWSRPFARNVGELGFGTNKGVGEFIAMNSHINERRPGLHIGFGQHNQSIYLLDYDCEVHMDMIARGGSVWVDNSPVPIDLTQVTPSSGPHPTLVLSEDIDGDCCGFWLSEAAGTCLLKPLTPAQVETRKRLEARQGQFNATVRP